MSTSHHESGICPHCREEGELGAACPERGCVRRGYHRIPAALVPDDGVIEPEIGLLLDRRYLLVRMLGEGGFGRVFVALQMPLRRQVAVKVLKKDRDTETHESRMRLFRQEAEAMARLAHPNIVQIQDFGFFEGAAYLVLEYLDGGRTLKDELRRRSRERRDLTLPEVEAILSGILNGLEEAHTHRIIHRDVKPENVMLQVKPGHPYLPRLLDFGLAKFVDAETQSSAVLGTPAYMAPEQLTKKDPGPWTDLYALGVMAFELMTGRRPFTGEVGEILADKRDPTFDVLASIADLQVPEPIGAFLRRALAHDPLARFRSTEAFREAMKAAFSAAASGPSEALRSIDLSDIARATPSADVRRPPRVRPATASAPVAAVASAPVAAPAPRRRGAAAAWIAGGVMVLGGGIGAAIALGGGGDGAPPVATNAAPQVVKVPDQPDTRGGEDATQVAALPAPTTAAPAVPTAPSEDVVTAVADAEVPRDAAGGASDSALAAASDSGPAEDATAKEALARAKRERAAAAAKDANMVGSAGGGPRGESPGGSEGATGVLLGGAAGATPGTNDLPAKLSPAQVKGGLASVTGRLRGCGTPDTAGLTLKATFTIVGSGSVTSVIFPDDGGASADVKACITRQLRTARFPRFTDPTMSVTLPIRL